MTIGNAEMAHLQMEAHKAMLAATNAKKPRRTAVERAAESLEKAKTKARARLLKLAHDKLEEALDLLNGAGGDLSYPGDEHDIDVRDAVSCCVASVSEELSK